MTAPPKPAAALARRHPPAVLVGAAFLLSGFTGLVLQVVWSKSLSLLLGSTLYAVSTVVAVFLLGLALGAVLAGRVARRIVRPLMAYGLLEIGVGLYAFLSLPLLAALDPLVGRFYAGLGPESVAYLALRVALAGLVLLPPTILMGASLPWLVAWATRAGTPFGLGLGRLYGINTLGAVLGAAAAGFWLVPGFGLAGTTWIVGAIAALLGTAIAGIGLRDRLAPEAREESETARASESPGRWTAAILFGLSGALALTLEVTWARIFGLVFGSSVYSFALVLAAYLLGIALGSLLWGGRLAESRRPWLAFAGLQVALAAGVAFGLWLLPELPRLFAEILIGERTRLPVLYVLQAGLAGLVVWVPCLALGALFPVGARLVGGSRPRAAEATGLAYAANTLGTVTGTLAAGFVLLPGLGAQRTLIGAGVASLALAALALWCETRLPRLRSAPAPVPAPAASPAPRKGKLRGRPRPAPGPARRPGPAGIPLAAGAAAAVVLAAVLLAPRWDRGLFTLGVYRSSTLLHSGASDAVTARGELERRLADEAVLFYDEGLHSVVSVHTLRSEPTLRSLRVNGKPDASNGPDMVTQIMLGHLPMLWAPPGARVCVIGHGSGVTARAALAHDPASLTVVEIEPAVLEASHFFDDVNEDVLDDPRVEVVLEDGRQHLQHAGRTYDVIVSEPSNPWIAGVNNLFTVDFYRRAREALGEGGVFCQWVQFYELSPEALGSLLSSFAEVFPAAEAFLFSEDLLLIAHPEGRRVPAEKLLPRTHGGPSAAYLERFGLLRDGYVPAHHLGRVRHLLEALPAVPRNTDDRPFVEYRAPFDLYRSSAAQPPAETAALAERDLWTALSRWVEPAALAEVALAAGRVLAVEGEAERARRLAEAGSQSGAIAPEAAVALAEATRRAAANEAVESLVLEAQEALEADDRGRLEGLLGQIFDRAPESAPAHVIAGRVAMREERLAVARTHLEQAVQTGKPSARCIAWINLGIIAMREGDVEAGRRAFVAATRALPGEPEAHVNLARWYVATGRVDSAQVVLERGRERAFPKEPIDRALANLNAGRSF